MEIIFIQNIVYEIICTFFPIIKIKYDQKFHPELMISYFKTFGLNFLEIKQNIQCRYLFNSKVQFANTYFY